MYNIKNGLDFLTLPNPFIYKALLIADNIQYDSELNIVFIIYYSHTPMREQQVLYFVSSQSTLL